MAKKKLLSEAQVRRFMGLAGINPLNEMYHDEDKMKEGYGLEEDLMEEEEPEEMGAEEAPEEMEMGAEEAPEEMEMEAEDVDIEMDEEDLAELKSALDTVQSVLSPLLDKAEGGEDMDMGDDQDMPELEMDAEEAPEEMDMEDEEMDKELQEINMELTEEEIVNEVARRVAKRIVEAKRAHKKMNEALGRKNRRTLRRK